jgi:hypothetical protein
MAGRTVVAIALIVLGLADLGYGSFSFTHKEKILDLGAVEITRDKHETLPLPPIAGGLLVVAGVALLVTRGSAQA